MTHPLPCFGVLLKIELGGGSVLSAGDVVSDTTAPPSSVVIGDGEEESMAGASTPSPQATTPSPLSADGSGRSVDASTPSPEAAATTAPEVNRRPKYVIARAPD